MPGLAPSPDDFDLLAQERFEDARALFDAGRFAGAHYVCGYVMEMKLKSRLCKVHGWTEYPPRAGERFAQALKTHKLGELLLFTGMESTLVQHGEWSVVLVWDPEQRYRPSAVTAAQARAMIDATALFMMVL